MAEPIAECSVLLFWDAGLGLPDRLAESAFLYLWRKCRVRSCRSECVHARTRLREFGGRMVIASLSAPSTCAVRCRRTRGGFIWHKLSADFPLGGAAHS